MTVEDTCLSNECNDQVLFISSNITNISSNITNDCRICNKTKHISISPTMDISTKYEISTISSHRISKSWSGNNNSNYHYKLHQTKKKSKKKIDKSECENISNEIITNDFKPYDPVNKCKSAGIIPYTIHNNQLYFLLQRVIYPVRKKDSGWNDFGGKKMNSYETTTETAAREFSEETSCLFYLEENSNDEHYQLLKNNKNLEYDENAISLLRRLIPLSQKYFNDRITEYVLPIYVSSKETYISYLLKVKYINEKDIPAAEDIHISYEDRYLRTCKWFSLDELMKMNEKEFHKRLQITRIQQRIMNYYIKGLLV